MTDIEHRLQRLEAMLGGKFEPDPKHLDQIERAMIEMMNEHDWDYLRSDDEHRRAFGESTYNQILRLADQLPTSRAIKIWDEFHGRNDPDPELSKQTARKLLTRIKHRKAERDARRRT